MCSMCGSGVVSGCMCCECVVCGCDQSWREQDWRRGRHGDRRRSASRVVADVAEVRAVGVSDVHVGVRTCGVV